MESLNKITKDLIENNGSPARDVTPGVREYETEVLPTLQQHELLFRILKELHTSFLQNRGFKFKFKKQLLEYVCIC
jgi:hypothetical protein